MIEQGLATEPTSSHPWRLLIILHMVMMSRNYGNVSDDGDGYDDDDDDDCEDDVDDEQCTATQTGSSSSCPP